MKPTAPARRTAPPQMVLDETARLRELPPVLRGIVRALGWERATDWLREHGGLVKRIPQARSHALGLSIDELQRLNDELSTHLEYNTARRIALPKVDKLYLQLRDARIRRAASSRSIGAIAKEHRLTTRRVQQIKALDDSGGGQGALW